MHLRGLVYVFENPHYSEYGSGINAFAQRLIVEADVAAGDWELKLLAGPGYAIDGLRKLPHDMRLFRIAEVQAVGCAHGSRARTGNLAGSFRASVHSTQPRIEITPASVAIERHRQAALRTLDTNHAPVACSRRFNRVGLNHVIVLLPHPTLAANVGAC